MSVQSAINLQSPESQSIAVYIQTIDGRKLPAVQHSSIVLDVDGKPDIVEGSIFYTDALGDIITDVVEFIVETDNTIVYWFNADGLPSIYWQAGSYFNADGTAFTGAIENYKAVGTSIPAPIVITRTPVYVKAGDFYYSATQVRNGDVVTYEVDGRVATISNSYSIVYNLPAPQYQDEHTTVTAANLQVVPSAVPISGFTIAYEAPLKTKRNPVVSTVTIGSATRTRSGSYSLNSEDSMGTVIPPFVSVVGNAIAYVVYRQRLSPLMGEGVIPDPADVRTI